MHELEAFYKKFRTVKIKRGEIIFIPGVQPLSAYAIKSGTVRVYTISSHLEEKSISFIVRNEVFPVCWLFSKTDSTLFYYVAHTDCELYVLEKNSFHSYLQTSSSLAYAILDHSISDYVAKSMQIMALEQPTANAKILHTLNYFSLRYGKQLMDDLVRITIPLTQKDIASFAGVTRETAALELSSLRKTKIISVKNKLYTLNTTRLHDLAPEEQNDDINITG